MRAGRTPIQSRLGMAVVEGTDAKTTVIDPLGAN